MIDLPAVDFDLAATLNSGQVFHWEKVGDGFCGAIGDHAVYVEQRGKYLRVEFEGEAPRRHRKKGRFVSNSRAGSQEPAPRSVARIAHNYFALDHPLNEICASFPRDTVMNAARDFCRGLRIIRQPKWECLATFICSSMKQLAHIRQISLALRRRFGDRRRVDDHVVYTFPPAHRIARATENDLRECALGYRAKNLLMTARLVSSGEADLDV